jgi:hypothetical protein
MRQPFPLSGVISLTVLVKEGAPCVLAQLRLPTWRYLRDQCNVMTCSFPGKTLRFGGSTRMGKDVRAIQVALRIL